MSFARAIADSVFSANDNAPPVLPLDNIVCLSAGSIHRGRRRAPFITAPLRGDKTSALTLIPRIKVLTGSARQSRASLNGRVTSRADGTGSAYSQSFGYDPLGRLTSASSTAWGNGSYVYDPLGNIRQKTMLNRSVTTAYDSRNRLVQAVDTGATGTRGFAYDGRGNITMAGSLTMGYDMSDQPVSVTGNADGGNGSTAGAAVSGAYLYDGNFKRVRSVINGDTIYNLYDAGGTLRMVYNASKGERTDSIIAGGVTLARAKNDILTYLHPDTLGSSAAGTTQAGNVAWRERYTPFGESFHNPADNDNQAGYTGHIKDADTGLVYMQARLYDPVIGRFLSIDPVTFLDTGNPGYFNRYSYVGNDPINAIDPFGKCATDKSGNETGVCGNDTQATTAVDSQLKDTDSKACN